MSTPALATEAAAAGNFPANRFNQRERKLLASVKTYVDAQTAAQNQLSELTDTNISSPSSGQVLLWDGTDSWDNKSLSGDATVTSAGALTIATGAVSTAKLAADAVDNTKLADGSVSIEQLDSGISPAYVVKYGGTFTTAGGDASETITVTGAASTDLVFVGVKTAGAVAKTVTAAAAASNAINVTMSGDPSTDHVLAYVVWRAAT